MAAKQLAPRVGAKGKTPKPRKPIHLLGPQRGMADGTLKRKLQEIKKSAIKKATLRKQVAKDLKRQGIDLDKIKAETHNEDMFLTAEEREARDLERQRKQRERQLRDSPGAGDRAGIKGDHDQEHNDGASLYGSSMGDSEEEWSGIESESGEAQNGAPESKAEVAAFPKQPSSTTPQRSSSQAQSQRELKLREGHSNRLAAPQSKPSQPQPQQQPLSASAPNTVVHSNSASNSSPGLSRDRVRKIMAKARGGQAWNRADSEPNSKLISKAPGKSAFQSRAAVDRQPTLGEEKARFGGNRRREKSAGPRKLSLESKVLLDRARKVMSR